MGVQADQTTGALDRRTLRILRIGRPWPRSCHSCRDGLRQGRQDPRPEDRDARQHGRLSLYLCAVRADLAAPGWLVVGEWDYPGWRARVDGIKQPIYRAHYGLRAVPLEAGTHEIEFVFRPVTFYAGAALSLVALGAAIVLAARRPGLRRD